MSGLLWWKQPVLMILNNSIESGISSFNTVKIVPLTNYQDVLSKLT